MCDVFSCFSSVKIKMKRKKICAMFLSLGLLHSIGPQKTSAHEWHCKQICLLTTSTQVCPFTFWRVCFPQLPTSKHKRHHIFDITVKFVSFSTLCQLQNLYSRKIIKNVLKHTSGRQKMFWYKGVLKIQRKFTGNHTCHNATFINLQSKSIYVVRRHGCSVNLLLFSDRMTVPVQLNPSPVSPVLHIQS